MNVENVTKIGLSATFFSGCLLVASKFGLPGEDFVDIIGRQTMNEIFLKSAFFTLITQNIPIYMAGKDNDLIFRVFFYTAPVSLAYCLTTNIMSEERELHLAEIGGIALFFSICAIARKSLQILFRDRLVCDNRLLTTNH